MLPGAPQNLHRELRPAPVILLQLARMPAHHSSFLLQPRLFSLSTTLTNNRQPLPPLQIHAQTLHRFKTAQIPHYWGLEICRVDRTPLARLALSRVHLSPASYNFFSMVKLKTSVTNITERVCRHYLSQWQHKHRACARYLLRNRQKPTSKRHQTHASESHETLIMWWLLPSRSTSWFQTNAPRK